MPYTLTEPKIFCSDWPTKNAFRLNVVDVETGVLEATGPQQPWFTSGLCVYAPNDQLESIIVAPTEAIAPRDFRMLDPDTLDEVSSFSIDGSNPLSFDYVSSIDYNSVTDQFFVIGKKIGTENPYNVYSISIPTGDIISATPLSFFDPVAISFITYSGVSDGIVLATDYEINGPGYMIYVTDISLTQIIDSWSYSSYIDGGTGGNAVLKDAKIDNNSNLNLLVREISSGDWFRYIFNGVNEDLIGIEAMPLPPTPGAHFSFWGGGTPSGDPITGNPEVDGILQVIDGVWENPNGPNSHGAYTAEVVKIAKMLGYRGKDLADIVKAASQSDVNK